ncbi:MAG: hydroxymethylpyrimidine/phosphomethylpyrimidine kinase [Flavobacteriaceae bacterium]
MDKLKYILSIAGFDSSNGAGIGADLKTYESHGLYGLSVCTAVTIQNESEFEACHWIPIEVILDQIQCVYRKHPFKVVKIGIVENWLVLESIISCLKKLDIHIKIIVDPVLKASTSFEFHNSEDEISDKILSQIDLLTPNYDEIKSLYLNLSLEQTISRISSLTNLYLKGGHRADKKGHDVLIHNKIVEVNIPPILENVYPKHGSGCVLSSAISANITLGQALEDACKNAKYYTENYLNSSPSLLGKHNYN